MNTPQLETPRLILRKFTENDIPAIYSILCDEKINEFLPWFPLKSFDEAKSFYEEHYASEYAKKNAYAYAVCLKSENIPIGYVNVGDIGDAYDLGYGICKEHWHKGIVTEACTAVIGLLKRDGIPYITATHDVKNPQSGGVMRKLGMKYCYSYMEQWQPKNIPVIFRMYQLNFDGNYSFVYKKYWDMYEEHFIENLTENK